MTRDPAVVTADTEALYREMPREYLLFLRSAFTMDLLAAERTGAGEDTRRFAQGRIDLITRLLEAGE